MSCPACTHLKQDGVLCGSPALRGKKLCFYHHRDHQRRQYVERLLRLNDPLRPSAPLPRNPFELQVLLYEVMTAVAEKRITTRRAGKVLYALQQTSASIPKPESRVPHPFPSFGKGWDS
jgi:hypothetical protein